jgi:glycine/D-amino acid oxidase-like deaminating enzyme
MGSSMNRRDSPESPDPSAAVIGAPSWWVPDGDHVDVVVVGGGQAGLAIGFFLAQQGRRFLIVGGRRFGWGRHGRTGGIRLPCSRRVGMTHYRSSAFPEIPTVTRLVTRWSRI